MMYSIAQAAVELSVSEKSVRRWINAGKIKAVDIGRLKKIHPSEIERISSSGLNSAPDISLTVSVKKTRVKHKSGGIRPWEELGDSIKNCYGRNQGDKQGAQRN